MYKDFLAGCVAGSSGVLIGHPLDTLKARLQLTQQSQLGPLQIFHRIVRQEGFFALYRGMAAPLVSAGLLNSMLFSGYTITLKMLRRQNEDGGVEKAKGFRTSEIIFASTVGTFFQLLPAIPIELIKTKLQTQSCFESSPKQRFNGPLDCAVKIVKSEGIFGLYRGGAVMFWRDLIGYFFYIPAYEFFWRNLSNEGRNEDFCKLLAGGMAGSLSWWIICPLELVKNRMQAGEKMKQNVRLICLEIYHQGRNGKNGNYCAGLRAFYRGGFLLAIRAFPVNACVFFVHSKCMEML